MNNNDNKPFSSPSRPLSRDQFQSLREKLVTDSPRLYKQKILSYPKLEKNNTHMQQPVISHSVPSTPRVSRPFGDFGNLSLNEHITPTTTTTKAANVIENEIVLDDYKPITTELGNFENPVLKKLINRSVIKEQELYTMSVNALVLALFILLENFIKLFMNHTKYGQQFNMFALKSLWKLRWVRRFYGNNLPNDIFSVPWDCISIIMCLVFLYNMSLSACRLLSSVKTSDLNLSDKQKELLGLDKLTKENNHSRNEYLIDLRKPHEIQTQNPLAFQNNEIPSAPNMQQPTPSTPYLFKSLQTPLKVKQNEMEKQQVNLMTSRTNVFDDLRRNALINNKNNNNNNNQNTTSNYYSSFNSLSSLNNKTTEKDTYSAGSDSNKAYIPSGKYSYLMNSPGPLNRS